MLMLLTGVIIVGFVAVISVAAAVSVERLAREHASAMQAWRERERLVAHGRGRHWPIGR